MAATRRSPRNKPAANSATTSAAKDGASVTEIERRRQAARRSGGASFHARRKELLAVAAQVFREKGMSRMSLGDIAERAKVDRATIYYYFRSKEDLFEQLIYGVVSHNVEEIEAITQLSEPPATKLRRALEALMISFTTHDPYAAVYVEEFLSRDSPGRTLEGFEDVRKLGRRYDRAMRGIIREGIDSGLFRAVADEKTIASMIVGMMNSSVRWQRTRSIQATQRAATAMADLILGGLETATTATTTPTATRSPEPSP